MRPSSLEPARLCTIATLLIVATFSCTKTVFSGQHRSLLSVEEGEKLVVLDFTGLEPGRFDQEGFTSIPGSDLPFVHTYCINNSIGHISEACIAHFKELYNTSYVVVCRPSQLHAGESIHTITDYEMKVKAQRELGDIEPKIYTTAPVTETNNFGKVGFDIYDTQSGEKINTFEVSVRVSGMGYGHRKDEGKTYMNFTHENLTLVKARRKGLKNIAKRLIQ